MSAALSIPPYRPKPRGPKPRFAERKVLMCRVIVEIGDEFEGYCRDAGKSLSEKIAALVEEATLKERERRLKRAEQGKPIVAPPAPKPAPATPPTPMSSPLRLVKAIEDTTEKGGAHTPVKANPWVQLSAVLKREMKDEWHTWIEPWQFVSYENLKLTLEVGNFVILYHTREHLLDYLQETARRCFGDEAVTVCLRVDEVADAKREREHQESERQKAKERQLLQQEAIATEKKRGELRTRLKELFKEKTPQAANEAQNILLDNDGILGAQEHYEFRRLLLSWLDARTSKTTKEAIYRGNRNVRR